MMARRSKPRRKSIRVFLFLQGPVSPFFTRLANTLERAGHKVARVNICYGDRLFWRRAGGFNYTGTFADWRIFIADFMDGNEVTDLILLGEQRPYHMVAIEEAKSRSVSVTVTELGYLRPNWITFEKDGMGPLSKFPSNPKVIKNLAGNVPVPNFSEVYKSSFRIMAAWDIKYHMSNVLFRFTHAHYRTHHKYGHVRFYLGRGRRFVLAGISRWRAERKIAATRASSGGYYFFPLQLETDFQVRSYSDYSDLQQAVLEVIASFSRAAPANTRLLIKMHPGDPGIFDWRRYVRDRAGNEGVATRVDLIDGGALEPILKSTLGTVTINSTVGLTALRTRCPVIVLGKAIYDIEGLTCRGPLDNFWTSYTRPDPELCEAFVRLLAGTVQIRGDFFREPGLTHAVTMAAMRLDRNLVNAPMHEGSIVA